MNIRRVRRLGLALAMLAFAASVGGGTGGSPAAAAPGAGSPPATGVVFEGVRYLPGNPALRNAQFFVIDGQAQQEGVIYGFRNRAAASARVNMSATPSASDRSLTSNDVHIWEYPNQGGEELVYGPGTYIAELSAIGRHCVLLWCETTWNNAPSSVQTNKKGVTFGQFNNMKGKELWIAPFRSVNLGDEPFPGVPGKTWNNVPSSLIVDS
jgi:hypothetical protein